MTWMGYGRKRTGGWLQGGVSSATVMDGPIEQIEAEVRQRLWTLGRDGGYVCQIDQSLPYPQAHQQAFQAAVEQFGRPGSLPPA